MKCIENISLEKEVFKSLFIQIIDGLNFGHIYDDYMAIRKCLSKFRRIFLKPRFLLVFRGNRCGDQLSPREFRVSRGGGGAKETCHGENFVTVSLFSLLKS